MAQALLDPSVAGAEHLWDGKGDESHDDPADRPLDPTGERQAPEQIRDSIETLGVEETDESLQHADQGKPHQMCRIREVVTAGEAEQRREPHNRAEDDVADERSDKTREQCLCVRSRRGRESPLLDSRALPSGASKMTPMPDPMPVTTAMRASAGLRSNSHAPRCETSADLAGRSLSASRSAGPDGQSRRHDLDDHSPETDAPRVVMDGRDGGVGTVTLRLPGANRKTIIPPSRAPSPTTNGSAQGRVNDADAR